MPKSLVLAVVVIGLAAAWRLVMLRNAPAPPADLSGVRRALQQLWDSSAFAILESGGTVESSELDQSLVELGIRRVEIQRFDPQAGVVIVAGADGQPGVQGVDDNGDGIVDNRLELGATGSDDECKVIPSGAAIPPGEPSLVLQRGAYVAIAEAENRQADDRTRTIVFGKTGQENWSFVFEP